MFEKFLNNLPDLKVVDALNNSKDRQRLIDLCRTMSQDDGMQNPKMLKLALQALLRIM